MKKDIVIFILIFWISSLSFTYAHSGYSGHGYLSSPINFLKTSSQFIGVYSLVSIDNEYVTFHINKSIFKESPEELVFTLTFIEKQFHLIEKKMAGAEDSQFIIAIKKLEDQHSFINSNKVVKIPGVGFALFKYNTFLEKLFNSGLSNTKIKAVVINEKLLELEQTSKISQRFFMLELFFNRKTLLSKVTKQTWENIFVKLSRPNTIDYFAKEKLLQTASLKNSNIESKDLFTGVRKILKHEIKNIDPDNTSLSNPNAFVGKAIYLLGKAKESLDIPFFQEMIKSSSYSVSKGAFSALLHQDKELAVQIVQGILEEEDKDALNKDFKRVFNRYLKKIYKKK